MMFLLQILDSPESNSSCFAQTLRRRGSFLYHNLPQIQTHQQPANINQVLLSFKLSLVQTAEHKL